MANFVIIFSKIVVTVGITFCLLVFLPNVFVQSGSGNVAVFFVDDPEEIDINAAIGQSNLQIEAKIYVSFVDDFDVWGVIEVYHVNIPTTDERLIGSLDDYVTPNVVVQGYSVWVVNDENDNTKRSIFMQFDSVQFIDDGVISFRISTDGDTHTKDRELTVLHPLEQVKVKLGDSDPVSSTTAVTLTAEEEENEVTVAITCIADGSNPQTTSLTLFVDGESYIGEPEYERYTDVRKYMTQATRNVTLAVRTRRHHVECKATDPTAQTLSTDMWVEVSGVESLKPLQGMILLLAVMFVYQNNM